MKLELLSEMYRVDKKDIRRWCSIWLLRYKKDEATGQRIYTEETEEDLKLIWILRASGLNPETNLLAMKREYRIARNPYYVRRKYGDLIRSHIPVAFESVFEEHHKALNWLDEIEG